MNASNDRDIFYKSKAYFFLFFFIFLFFYHVHSSFHERRTAHQEPHTVTAWSCSMTHSTFQSGTAILNPI